MTITPASAKEASDMSRSAATPEASVVIPTYNRCDELAKTLETMTEQDIDCQGFEVIVADDGSSDETPDVARSFAGRLRLKYYFQEDEGFRAGAARNAGARLAAAPILIFLDSGTLAAPGLVRCHLAAHAGSAERRAVMGCCYGYNKFQEKKWVPDSFYALRPEEIVRRYGNYEQFADVREPYLRDVGNDPMKWVVPWIFFFTMNCSVPAADFWAVDGFDEMFRSWGSEDVELGYRLYHNGSTMVLSRDAWAIEMPQDRPVKRLLYSLMRNVRLFLDKHHDPYVEIMADAYQDLRFTTIMEEFSMLERWTREAHDAPVRAEIEAVAAGLAADTRIAVFGCGASVPDWLPPAALADFDADLLFKATTGGPHTGYHAIGLRTALPSKSADVVIVTSRLGGLWDRHGDQILREAGRVGERVVLASGRC
jgi:glycosyltransferase involved in cell wall biosynthesis